MNKSIIQCCVVFLLLAVCMPLQAQSKRDYNWLFGASRYPTGVMGNLIDFNNKGQVDTIILGAPFFGNNAIISDEDGKLLFYSNGCKVIDATHQLMENGDSINYGETWDKYCKYNALGYPGDQNSIILPDPGNKDGYYLIHKRLEIKTEPIIESYNPELYYSYINMNYNAGRGKVLTKNRTIFRTNSLLPTFLTACKHENGASWWVIDQKKDENLYFKVLIESDKVMVTDSQYIGPILTDESGFGQAVFSPSGDKYLLYTNNEGALVYDFDRSTGMLSNFRQVMVQDSGQFVGVAIAPNSRYAYLSSLFDLYQIDLWADDIQSTLTHIDHIDGFTDPYFLSYFNHAQLGPDCKIYIVSGSTNNYLHVINKPNEKGKACDFRQHSLYLPKRNYNNCIPNFPHFRMDEDEICDPTISWLPELFYVKSQIEIKISPNPASSEISISSLEPYKWQEWGVYTITGQKIKSGTLRNEADFRIQNLSLFEPGVYFVKLRSNLGDMAVGKFVLQ